MNKRWIKRIAEGVCVHCGIRKPVPNKNGCRKCAKRLAANNKRYCESHPGYSTKYYHRIKLHVIEKYGGKCNCCGETKAGFLTIDHINEDGGFERRNLFGHHKGNKNGSGSSKRWYQKLKKDPIRDDLQILCYNCNCGSFRNGGICPHKE